MSTDSPGQRLWCWNVRPFHALVLLCTCLHSIFSRHRKGKGLAVNGSKNVIIQNIQITDINEEYVWGGDGVFSVTHLLFFFPYNTINHRCIK
jgi:hypothetical protein